MQKYHIYYRLWRNIYIYIYIYVYRYIKCSFKMFIEKVCVSKINRNIKIKTLDYTFFKIPTNNFSCFEDFTFLRRYLYVHLIHKFGIFEEKSFDYHMCLISRQKILMTHYKNIMTEWFICQCTMYTNILNINCIVINILTF